MPPPSENALNAWHGTVAKSPELQKKWGTTFPVDSQGNVNPDALRDLISTIKSAQQPAVAAEDPSKPGRYTRWVTGVEDPGTPAEPPRPVDWGQRFKDIGTGALQVGMGIPYDSPIGKYLPGYEVVAGRQREAREAIDPEATGFMKYLSKVGAGMSPMIGALQAGEEITSPARGALQAFTPFNVPFEALGGQMPRIGEPSVRRWYGELRDQGYGHFESLQAAVEQAEREGTVGAIQEFGGKLATDPLELTPGLGLYSGVTKAVGKQALKTAGKEAIKELAKEAPEVVAKEAVEEAPKIVAKVARGAAKEPWQMSQNEWRDIVKYGPTKVEDITLEETLARHHIENPGQTEAWLRDTVTTRLKDGVFSGGEIIGGPHGMVYRVSAKNIPISKHFTTPNHMEVIPGLRYRLDPATDKLVVTRKNLLPKETRLIYDDVEGDVWADNEILNMPLFHRTPMADLSLSSLEVAQPKWSIFAGNNYRGIYFSPDPGDVVFGENIIEASIDKSAKIVSEYDLDFPKYGIDQTDAALERGIDVIYRTGLHKSEEPLEIIVLNPKVLRPGIHEQSIRKALTEGKPVPNEVLREYPDLAPAADEVVPEIAARAADEVVPEGGPQLPLPLLESGRQVVEEVVQPQVARADRAAIPTQEPVLPRELRGAKPRYNIGQDQYIPTFDSDIDKALFIVAQRTPSKRDADYMNWLRGIFPDMDDLRIRQAGKEVREHIKNTVRGQEDGPVQIPRSRIVEEIRQVPVEEARRVPIEEAAGPRFPEELIPGSGVTPDTILPTLSKALREYSTSVLEKRLNTASPSIKFYKAELLRRKKLREAGEIAPQPTGPEVPARPVQFVEGRTNEGVSMEMLMEAHPLDELIRRVDSERVAALERWEGMPVRGQKGYGEQPLVRISVDDLFTYKYNPGKISEAEYKATLDYVARRLQKSNKEVEDYINYYDNEARLYSKSVDDLLNRIPEQGTPEEAALLQWHFMPDPNDPSKMVVRYNRPLSPGAGVYRGVEAESLLAEYKNAVAGSTAGDIPHSSVSEWLKMMKPHFAQTFLFDEVAQSLRDAAANFKVLGEETWQTGIRRMFGIMTKHEKYWNDVVEMGNKELEQLGFDRSMQNLIGSTDEPGPMRILNYALDEGPNSDWFRQLQELGPDWVRQYYNARTLTNWEQDLRLLNDQIHVDTLMTVENYFNRGLRPREGEDAAQLLLRTKKKQDSINLGQREGFQIERVDLTLKDLEELGWERMFISPYDQAIYSASMGARQRLQIELGQLLRDDGLMDIVWSQEAVLTKRAEGYRELADIEAYAPITKQYIPRKYDSMPDIPVEMGEVTLRYMVPERVAKIFESMFNPPKVTFMKKQRVMWGPWKLKFKWDDFVFIPKRMKLFGSFFQQADFGQRPVFGGSGAFLQHTLLGLKMAATPGSTTKGIGEIIKASEHVFRIPQAWADIVRANVSPARRQYIAKQIKSNEPIWADHPDPVMREITWPKLMDNGIALGEPGDFLGKGGLVEEMQKAYQGGVEKGWGKNALAAIKRMEQALRNGLFDGVYPAAIMFDVKHNMIPVLRLAHPEMNADQLMSLVAKEVNKAYSVIPKAQSVIQGSTRELGSRAAFSIHEMEAGFRGPLSAIRGENKMYWLTRYIGGFAFMAAVAQLIHYAHTGEALPVRRYIPMNPGEQSWYRFNYNSAWLAPDIGIATEGGERATLDLIMQQDTIFRAAEWSRGLPFMSFVSSRESVPVNAALTQFQGRDFFGREIDKTGFAQRLIQGVYDTAAPIGAGQMAVATLARGFEDKSISAGPDWLIKEGTTIKDLLPSSEERLGYAGEVMQGVTGLNVRAKNNKELQDQAVKNTFGSGDDPVVPNARHITMSEIEKEPEKKRRVYDDPRNATIFAEINRRRELGVHYGTSAKFSELLQAQTEARKDKLAHQARIFNNYGWVINNPNKGVWEPRDYREEVKNLNMKHQAEIARLEEAYGVDPDVRRKLDELQEEPVRSEGELNWAVWHYFNIKKENLDKSGKLNYKEFEKEWDAKIDEWDSDPEVNVEMLSDRVNAYLQKSTNNHPFLQLYYSALDTIEESGYWKQDFPQQMASLRRMVPEARAIWNQYLNASTQTKRGMRAGGESKFVIKTMEDARKTHRMNVRLKNSNVDALIIFWMGANPVHLQNAEFWKRLYSTPEYPRAVKFSR